MMRLPDLLRPDAKLILIIGDGMDDQQITIARNYLVGSAGRLALDDMAHRGAAQAQGVAENDPAVPVYVTSSANTATAMASGSINQPLQNRDHRKDRQ